MRAHLLQPRERAGEGELLVSAVLHDVADHVAELVCVRVGALGEEEVRGRHGGGDDEQHLRVVKRVDGRDEPPQLGGLVEGELRHALEHDHRVRLGHPQVVLGPERCDARAGAAELCKREAGGARLLARLRHVQRAAREAQRLRGRGRARDQRLPQPARAAPRRLVERVQEGARAVRRQLRERRRLGGERAVVRCRLELVHVAPLLDVVDEGEEGGALQPAEVEVVRRSVRGSDDDHAVVEEAPEELAQHERVCDVGDRNLVEDEHLCLARELVGEVRDGVAQFGHLLTQLVGPLVHLHQKLVQVHAAHPRLRSPLGREDRRREEAVHENRLSTPRATVHVYAFGRRDAAR
mmetsp:Transcript_12590/g.36959  ORF Transcript_12590/g.36959 Transcript_12590/m.36959 type:complete len:351 (+) Transcript_12590:356-1408(+)